MLWQGRKEFPTLQSAVVAQRFYVRLGLTVHNPLVRHANDGVAPYYVPTGPGSYSPGLPTRRLSHLSSSDRGLKEYVFQTLWQFRSIF